ncbi:hypothetical protein CLIM01_12840 [Colletotrichum limetticola]|uniref:Uncharacterized protein n=1 Tax=Colletotrichum limetticola TaxID=1209924 RepID=A0ABQ9PDY6_9PEZI|nr:hypothetical protein CLIM01_12840 [Colletotrichum limetticola]
MKNSFRDFTQVQQIHGNGHVATPISILSAPFLLTLVSVHFEGLFLMLRRSASRRQFGGTQSHQLYLKGLQKAKMSQGVTTSFANMTARNLAVPRAFQFA